MNKRLKRVAIISLIVAGALIFGAILLGVANALLADGAWTLGWKDFRYDESGYTVGDGSVHAERVTAIDLDWIDGSVTVVPCDDMFISLSERAEADLSEAAELRWKVDADGTLSVKHRKSQWFFGLGTNTEKELILRIPRKLFDGMQSISIEAESASVTVKDVFAKTVEVELDSGTLTLAGCRAERLSVETENGAITGEVAVREHLEIESENGAIELQFAELPHTSNVKTENGKVTLLLSRDANVTLTWQTERGQLSYDLPLIVQHEQGLLSDDLPFVQNGRYVLGNGAHQINVQTKRGNLLVTSHP